MMDFRSKYPNMYTKIKEVRENKSHVKEFVDKEFVDKGVFKSDYCREIVKLPQISKNMENVKFEHV